MHLKPWSDRAYFFIATGGGVGLIPFAPGTWGAAVGALLFLAITRLPPEWQTIAIAILLLLSCLGTILAGPWAERYFGRKDPGSFVSDEIAGILLTLLFFRLPGMPWLTLVWAFPMTRFFDILKPPPARRLEKLPLGWGVLFDDLASSIYAVLALQLLHWLLPAAFIWGWG